MVSLLWQFYLWKGLILTELYVCWLHQIHRCMKLHKDMKLHKSSKAWNFQLSNADKIFARSRNYILGRYNSSARSSFFLNKNVYPTLSPSFLPSSQQKDALRLELNTRLNPYLRSLQLKIIEQFLCALQGYNNLEIKGKKGR